MHPEVVAVKLPSVKPSAIFSKVHKKKEKKKRGLLGSVARSQLGEERTERSLEDYKRESSPSFYRIKAMR